MEKYLQFRISLHHVKPEVWRTFQVSELHSLYDLHQVIQVVMGWEDNHLFQFNKGGIFYGMPDSEGDNGPQFKDAGDVFIEDLNLSAGDTMGYEYDFGDGWTHTLTVLKRLELEEDLLPVALTGANACPFEDCGGPDAYNQLVKSLLHPKTSEDFEMKEVLGDFDPAFFDLEEVNEILADIDEEGEWDEDDEYDDEDIEGEDPDDDVFEDFDDDARKN